MKDQVYKITELPASLYISPKFLFDWWHSVQKHNGIEAAKHDTGEEYKLARELWVGAMYATAMRQDNDIDHWVARVDDTDPDATVAFFEKHEKGIVERKYALEVTTYGKYSTDLKTVIKKKLDKNYPDYTRIVCYVTDIETPEELDKSELRAWIVENNPSEYDVWLLYGLPGDKFILSSLNSDSEYEIDYLVDSLVPNVAEVFSVLGRGTSDPSSPYRLRGQLRLLYPKLRND